MLTICETIQDRASALQALFCDDALYKLTLITFTFTLHRRNLGVGLRGAGAEKFWQWLCAGTQLRADVHNF